VKKRLFIIVTIFLGILAIGLGWMAGTTNMLFNTLPTKPIQVYFADNISPIHQHVIDIFNKLHQGRIEVVPVNLPFDKFSTNERKELLARSLRSKSEKLDVFAVDLIWVPRFVRWSEPLDKYFSDAERQRLLSYALESCLDDRILVAMPLYIDVGLMYYRRDIIQRLPDAASIERRLAESISWDEMMELRKRLNYEHKPFYIFQAKDYEGLVCNFLELAANHQPDFIKRRSIELTSLAAEHALALMVDFVKTGVTPPIVTEFDENLSYTYMLNRDAVFVRGWPNFIENYRSFYADTIKLAAIGRAALPHFNGQPSTSVFGGWNLMVSKSSQKKEAAVEFIRFLQQDDIQRLLFEQGGYIPIVNSVYQDSIFLKSHSELMLYNRLVRRGTHRPMLVEYTKTSDIISHYAHIAIKQELPVREALRRADEMIKSNAVMIK
jgi:multiple sugar transport system substrate-binding protein